VPHLSFQLGVDVHSDELRPLRRLRPPHEPRLPYERHCIPTEHDVPLAFRQRWCTPSVPFVRSIEHEHVPLRCVCMRATWYACDAVRAPLTSTRTGTLVLSDSGSDHDDVLKKYVIV
jgi:hypothetical protein